MVDKKHNRYDTTLIIGEKVQLGVDEGGPPYPTLLEDILENGRLIVSAPTYRGIPLPVYIGKEVQFYFYRENGRYCIFCMIERIFMHNELRLLSLKTLTKPIKQQRRETFRLPISLDARICSFEETEEQPENIEDNDSNTEEPVKKEEAAKWETTITHNISETGVAIRSLQKYQVGDMVQIWMQIENGVDSERIDLLGTIRQVEEVEDKRRRISYRLGVEFLPYEEKIRRNIAKFILKKQQITLKMKRNEEYYRL